MRHFKVDQHHSMIKKKKNAIASMSCTLCRQLSPYGILT